MINLDSFLYSCIKANEEIYEYLNTHISPNDYLYSNSIGEGGDNSLHMDLKAEEIFLTHLLPFGDIYTEEAGFVKGNSTYKIIIDPLDGSSNFKAGLDYFASSVALQSDGKTICSVICNLCTHTLLYKIKNQEIKKIDLLSKKTIKRLNTSSKEMGIFEKAYAHPKISKKLYDNSIKFRSPGAVALSFANARNYSFVLFIGKIRDFDIKAALHMCEDLYVYNDNNFLIVSKDLHTFSLIKELIKE